MASVTNRPERMLRLSLKVYHQASKSAAEAHEFAVNDHVAKAAKIHAKHGIEMYQQVFTPEPYRAVLDAMAKRNNRGWVIDDHDLTVEFYFRSLADLGKLSADPEWQALQAEEEPYIDRRNTVVSLGWVEKYVGDGRVMNFGEDGKSAYPSYEELVDVKTAYGTGEAAGAGAR